MNAAKSFSVALALLVVSYFVFKVMFLKDELNTARSQLSEALNANLALNQTLTTLKETQEAAVKALNEKYIAELKENELINAALAAAREEFLSGRAEFLDAFNALEAEFEKSGVLQAENPSPKSAENVKTKFDFSGGVLEEENASAKRAMALTDEEREIKKREAIKEVFSNSWK